MTSHAAPVAYHRIATLRPAWSRPVKPALTIFATLVAYVVLSSVLLVTAILLLALAPGVNVALGVASGDPRSPLDVALALAMGVMWVPAGIVGVRIGGWRPLGTAWSVAAQWRRRAVSPAGILALAGGLAVVAVAAIAGAVAGSPAAESGGEGSPLAVIGVILLVVLLAPVQAVGVELSLRGVLLQGVGTWLRSPLLPILAATGVALIGRDLTPAVVVPALTVALCSAVLAWKSGGLEVSILLIASISAGAMILAALLAGSGAGGGVTALVAATAAPGSSGAGLGQAQSAAALAGGVAGSIGVILVSVGIMAVVGRAEGLRWSQPVRRAADAPVPAPVPI